MTIAEFKSTSHLSHFCDKSLPHLSHFQKEKNRREKKAEYNFNHLNLLLLQNENRLNGVQIFLQGTILYSQVASVECICSILSTTKHYETRTICD